jgi:rhodanese-related sulfurtransferase
MSRALVAAVVALAMLTAHVPSLHAADPTPNVPEAKQTVVGLYLTSREAYAKWEAGQENVKIIDVRTPEEYWFIGHASMAWNVPFVLVTHAWNAERNKLELQPNPDFVKAIKDIVEPGDTVLIMCRSGARSTKAVNLLAAEGFENVYNVLDGFEGDKVKDPANVFAGQRKKNGWRNSGLPWTYDLDADIVRLPSQP